RTQSRWQYFPRPGSLCSWFVGRRWGVGGGRMAPTGPARTLFAETELEPVQGVVLANFVFGRDPRFGRRPPNRVGQVAQRLRPIPSVAAPQPVGEDPVRNPEGLRGHVWISPSANEGAEIALELCRQVITLDGHGSNLHSENRLRELPGWVGRYPAAHAAGSPSRRSRVIEGIAHAPTAGAWRVRRTESQ